MESAPRRPRPRLRRFVLWAASILLALAVLLSVAWTQRQSWLSPWLKERIRAELEQRTGAQVSIRALAGGWISDVELFQITWRDAAPQARLPELDARRVRVEYSLLGALRGAPDWLRAVELDGVRAVVRTGGGEDAGEEPVPSQPPPARLPALKISDADVELLLERDRISLRGATLRSAPIENGTGARAHLALREFRLEREGKAPLAAAVEADLAWRAPRLSIESLRLDGVERLAGSWIDLSRASAGVLSGTVELQAFGGALSADATLVRGTLDASLALSGLALEPALDLVLGHELDWLEATMDGRGELHLEPDRPEQLRVRWSGRSRSVRLGMRRFDELELEAQYALSELAAVRLQARRGDDRITARDLAIRTVGSALEILRSARGEAELSLSNLPAWLEGERGELAGQAPPHHLDLALRLSEAGLDLERGLLTTAGGTFAVRPSTIVLGPGDELLDEIWIDVGLDVDFRDIGDLDDVLGLEQPLAGSLRGDLRLFGTLRSLVGRFDLEGREIQAAGLRVGDLRAVALVDAERLTVETLEATGELGEVALEGAWDRASERLERLQVRARVAAPQELWPAELRGGPIEVEALLEGELLDPRGSFQVRAHSPGLARAPWLQVDEVEIAGSLGAGRVEIATLVLHTPEVLLRARGALDHSAWSPPFELGLDRFTLSRGELELTLEEPARLRSEAGSLSLADLRLAGSLGRLEFDLAHSGETLSVRLVGQDLDPLPVIAPFVPSGFELEGARGEIELRRAGGELSGAAHFSIVRLRAARGLPEFGLQTRARLAGGRLELDQLSVDAKQSGSLELSGSLPFDPLGDWTAAGLLGPGTLDLRGRAHITTLENSPWARLGPGYSLSGSLDVDAQLGGEWRRITGSALLQSPRITLEAHRGGGTEVFGPMEARLALELGEALAVRELHLFAPGQLTLDAAGTLATVVDAVRAGREGRAIFLDAPLELAGEVSVRDIAWLSRPLSVRRIDGNLAGSMTLLGTLRSPRPGGRLELADGELRIGGDFPAVNDLQAQILVEPRKLRLESLSAELGGGSIGASGTLDWNADAPHLELEITGREALLVQLPTLRVRADADLQVSGPLDALELRGRLGVRDGRYTQNVEFFTRGSRPRAEADPALELFSFEQGPLSTLRLDVAIDSLAPFWVVNNLVKGSVRADLRLTGSGRSPELIGTLFVDETRVSLPACNLYTTAGTIRLEREDPLVPQLDLRLETRLLGYDVSVHVEGTPAEPEVELSSTPPLSSEELLLLVLTGKPPDLAWDKDTGGQAAQTVALYLGKDVLSRWLGGDDPGEESFLDRIEYRSGADVTQSGGETEEIAFRLFGAARGEGRAILLRAENDAYDRTNLGVRIVFRSR